MDEVEVVIDGQGGHEDEHDSGGGEEDARVKYEAAHRVDVENVAGPDEVAVNQAEEKQPEHAAIVNVGGAGGSAFANEAVDQQVDAGAESHREDRAHLSVGHDRDDEPGEEIFAGVAAGGDGIVVRGERETKAGDIHEENAEEGETANGIEPGDAFVGANGSQSELSVGVVACRGVCGGVGRSGAGGSRHVAPHTKTIGRFDVLESSRTNADSNARPANPTGCVSLTREGPGSPCQRAKLRRSAFTAG